MSRIILWIITKRIFIELFQSKKERAVAPIIATLLMVAIAVVGGILIFVFTQGFFADEQVVGPVVDNIRIFGYDTTDDTILESYDGVDAGGSGLNNGLVSGDNFVIYVENLGDKPVGIQDVRVFGESYTPWDEGGSFDNGEFAVQGAGWDWANTPNVIEPNTKMNIQIKYDGDAGTIKPGRTIPIQVETANGQSSQINVLNGAIRGCEGSCS